MAKQGNDQPGGDKPLLLVDGSSYLFRAFHALPDLQTSDGFHTGAVRGVISMLRKLAKDYQGSPIAVVFDAKGKTFRNDLYAEYKAHRPPMPDELREQIQPIHDIIRAMGLPLLIVPDVEADDVIGTLAAQATEAQRDTVVSTGDKDMAQLVTDHVTLVNTMTDTRLDRAGVIDKFGVPPERIVDYLALMGDSVDNIPGVAKVGPKTAAKWLAQYDSLEGVIAAADEIKGKVGDNLRDALDQLPLSRQLTEIKCDVELDVHVTDLVPGPPDEDALRELFRRLEFKTWLEELETGADGEGGEAGGGRNGSEFEWEIVDTPAALDAWTARLESAGLIAFDTETTSLNYMDAELVGFSFCVEPGRAAYLPVGHRYAGAPDQLPLDTVLERLKPILEDPDRPKVGQNLKYDLNVLGRYGIEVRGVAHDTMLESYVLDSVGGRHNMDDLAKRFLGVDTIHYEDVAGKGAKQIGFDEVPVEQAAEYAAEDADVAMKLHREIWPRLEAAPTLAAVYRDIELPLVPVLSRMERHGTLVDGGLLADLSAELAERMEALKAQAWSAAGEEFNVDSPKQLQAILFEKLALPVLKKTPKGQPSTAEAVLQDLAVDYELPRLIMDYRVLAKLKSTYTDKLPLQINQRTGRIHTSYHQAVAATGRLSSSDPNLQNIPIRHAEGRRIRQAFVAPPGRKILAADYSQIELRIMAHLSGDQGLTRAFEEDQDIHRATAAEVFGCTLDEVTGEQRRSAKAINFGLIYGMSAFGLGRQLGISRTLAQEYIDRYFERYPGVHAYMEQTRALAREQGYVETVFGRRLYLPEINAKQPPRRQGAERAAINAPMQGTAADIIKRAMITVDAWLTESALDALLIMQVHDELVFEVAESHVTDLEENVRARMMQAAELTVPLLVEVGVGANWDEAH
ncbi:MAG: DNA polymerase I [Gammaproteobacteria bacterium]|nr:DNA polymerase I [Gammaproteobacteria bacterium]